MSSIKIPKGWVYNTSTSDWEYQVYDSTGAVKTMFNEDGSLFQGGTKITATAAQLNGTSPVMTTPQINDTSADHQYIFAVSELAADRTVTLPLLLGNDEFVFKDFAQTLTNKTLTSPVMGTTPKVTDDSLFTIGTTVATAATKITMEFDATTTGIGQKLMGSLSVPQVLNANPGATVAGDVINILQSAGAGDCDDLLGAYVKVAFTGDGDSGTTAVAHASRAYAGTGATDTTVVKELYGSQPWVSHFGTGAVTAMSALSAKCDVNTGNFTASTVNAAHFHVEGASTVTAQFDGVMIEVYPDVTCLDSGLAIAVDSGAAVTSMIRVSGAATNMFEWAATGSGGATTSDPSVGAANCWIKCKVGSTITWLIGYADS